MAHTDQLKQILHRVEKGQQTDEDITFLRQLLSTGDRQLSAQLGKYNVNITEGKDIHIGDRIYNQWDKEAIEALVKAIQATSGIHQNTSNVYKNCTFIQLLSSDSNFSNLSQKSLNDLDFSRIPQESIQKAYQEALPPDADVWGLEGNNITQILQQLEQFRRLFEFFNRLSQDKNIPQEIRNQLSGIAEELALKKSPDEILFLTKKDNFNPI
jgi:hypothetical protein